MNLLIFPQYGYPANHAVVNTVYEDLLPSRGHAVHMIRPMAGVTQPQVAEASWTGGSLVVYPEQRSGNAFANALALVRRSRWLRQAVRKLDDVPLDAILVRNDLPSALVAMSLARQRRIPFIYQLSSPDAEFLMRLGRRSGGATGLYRRLRGRIDLAVRRWVTRRADAVLAISDAMREYLVAADTLDAKRVFSFPMGVHDVAPPTPAAIEALCHRLGLRRGRTIVYSGVIDPVRESTWMLDVLDRVRAQVPDVVLLVLTYQEDDRRRAFEDEARRRGAAVRIVGPLSHREVPMHLCCADVMLSPLPPILDYKISSPTKSLEGMCAGLPVVGSAEVVEHAMMFKQSGGGVAVPWDVAAFADAIVRLLRDPERGRSMGERGRRWVLEHRTYTRLTEYLERILERAGSPAALDALPHQVEF
jgi:glycosyltransferase involved in cell wall biosynthesis